MLGVALPMCCQRSPSIAFAACDSAQWLAHKGTVGKVLFGELHVLDAQMKPCPTGTPGTLWFKTATPFEYFNDPVKTADARSLAEKPGVAPSASSRSSFRAEVPWRREAAIGHCRVSDRGTNSELSVAPVLPYRVTTSAPTLRRSTTALVDVTADGIGSN
jgi:hypothetical protein